MDKWIGQRLEALRIQRHMSQKDLAAVVGHGQSWMSDVEQGLTDPGFHEVEALLYALETTLEEVVKNPGKLHSITINFNALPAPGTGTR